MTDQEQIDAINSKTSNLIELLEDFYSSDNIQRNKLITSICCARDAMVNLLSRIKENR